MATQNSAVEILNKKKQEDQDPLRAIEMIHKVMETSVPRETGLDRIWVSPFDESEMQTLKDALWKQLNKL